MRRILCYLAMALCLGSVSVARASIFISTDLATTKIDSKTYEVEIFTSIKTPGEIVAAYDLDLLYNHSDWNPTTVTFSPSLGDPVLYEVFQGYNFSVDGVVNLKSVSLITDEKTLLSMQSPLSRHLTLATVTFSALEPDTVSTLAFGWGMTSGGLRDLKGMNNMQYTHVVPEPSTFLLTLIGGSGIVVAVRCRRRKSGTNRGKNPHASSHR